MSKKEFIKFYSALGRDQELTLLSHLAHLATVAARDTYIPQTEAIADPVRLRRFNELQHHLTGRLMALSSIESNTALAGEFVKLLVAGIEGTDCLWILSNLPEGQRRKKAAVA